MKKLLLLVSALCMSAISFAQLSSNLIIFSEDGYPFYLILNGIRQNAKPETNIKIDGLTQPYYSAKIIFENKQLPILEKKVLQMQGVDETGPMEVTYKIKKNNKNVNVLRFYSQTPLAKVIEQPQNVTVVHYNTVPMPDISQVIITEHTTTTTNTTTDNVNMNVGMGMPNINMNVNVNTNEPVIHEQTTTVITTTSTHY